LSTAQQTLEQLGVPVQLLTMRTTAIRDQLARLNVPTLAEEVPAVKMAKARVEQARASLGGASFTPSKPYDHPAVIEAQKELEQAELNLSYTVLKSPIAGYVNRRSVNPGNQVQAGQMLMALRPLREVWIDANFKENQLDKLRIGQPVDLFVDAYPGRVFHGRAAGFSPGTGAALSLLPPENATGNFVKVVQRLPVRIELTEPPSEDTPLFVGLSVVAEVNIKAQPSGPDAGKRLLGRAAAPRAARQRQTERQCLSWKEESAMATANVAGQPMAVAQPGFNPWVIALTVTIATFMEVLDTSIANVALKHIAGSLAASEDESTWVLTSYLVANAIALPLSGWLSTLMGRKRFYMMCVALFTLSSALCGMATSLGQLVFFPVLQGIGGGGLQPSEQAILVDTFPPRKRGMAMAVYGMAILVAVH
jgi:biotin carboxyl carrier protein